MSRPCASCPYRRSAPLGLWDRAEFENLLRNDHSFGRTFACHLDGPLPPEERTLCRGWLADQKRRGLPNLHLRVNLITDPAAGALYDALDEQDPDLYASIEEMCDENRGRAFPARNVKALAVVRVLRRARVRMSRG